MVAKPIEVSGLAQLSKSLRRVSADAPKGLRLAMNESADLLIAEVVPTIPRRTGRAAKSLKARSTRTSARVAMGGRIAPWMPWLDFGGRTGPARSVERPFIKEGRYLFPGLERIRPNLARVLERGIVAVAEGAGLEVS